MFSCAYLNVMDYRKYCMMVMWLNSSIFDWMDGVIWTPFKFGVNFLVSLCGGLLDIMPLCSYFKWYYCLSDRFCFQYYWNTILTNLCFYSIFVNLDHKTRLKSLGYICSNSQKYMVWVKIIDFSFMPKIFSSVCKDHVPWRYFVDVLL